MIRKLLLRCGLALLSLALVATVTITPARIVAQDATPATGSAATDGLPPGPLGEQIAWLVDYINLPDSDAAGQDIAAKFTPEVLAQAPADVLQRVLGQVRAELAPVEIVTDSIVTTMDDPPTNARFLLLGRDGIQLPASLSVDPASGLISGLLRGTDSARRYPTAIASPEAVASPGAGPFPENEIGQQAAWTWELLQPSTMPVDPSEIEAHVDAALMAQAPADQVAVGLDQLKEAYGPFTIEPDSVITTRDEPPTNLSYIIVGVDGTRLQVALTLDPDSGLLSGFLITPAAPTASPVATPLAIGLSDTEVSFTSGPDTIYGSLMVPDDLAPDDSRAAALIISGSGPTDRDGNSIGMPLGTNRNLAVTLAEAGIPSLRYDKIGSGQTGLGSHVDGTGIDYELFLQQARDAAAFLAEQPGVDPSKLILVGHSEGALFALALAQELAEAGTPPAALILAAPLSIRYLDLLDEQLSSQLETAVAAGQITREHADSISAELAAIIESLRTTGELPATIETPELMQLFNPGSVAFLAQADQFDPADIAASLPVDLPVLVLLGEKDAQVTEAQVQHLLGGFSTAGNEAVTFVSIPNADHTLRVVEGEANPAVDYMNPDLPFSDVAVTAIEDFLAQHGLSSGA
ncbi:MAG: alpha/beta fold hydrolase [Thermomicrobiales bacterium]|nr:alpha/beta fold hydrolase [Thermomicrobiales bacterium]